MWATGINWFGEENTEESAQNHGKLAISITT
jgi:hypothetical protein